MRAIDCSCGHRLEGADDEELFRLAREHIDQDDIALAQPGDQLVAPDCVNLVAEVLARGALDVPKPCDRGIA